MSNIIQVDQSDIRKLEMRCAFFKGLTPKNQLTMRSLKIYLISLNEKKKLI